MTEQMKQALDQAAKGLQWSNGQILLNKENFKPTDPAVTPLDKLVSVPIPDKLETAVKFGANWYRNNVWHPASEKPSGSGKILYLGETGIHLTTYPPHFDWNDSVEKLIIQKWAWTEDLLPDESE